MRSGVAIARSANDRVRQAVGKRRVNAFQIAAAFKEVGVNQVDVQRVLLDVLPIGARLPGVLLDGGPIDQALGRTINRAGAADAQTDLIRLVLAADRTP